MLFIMNGLKMENRDLNYDFVVRGYCKELGKFVEGYYLKTNSDRELIVSPIGFLGEEQWIYREVIPETIGKSVRVCDKNGIQIFEGDKVKSEFGYKGTVEMEDWTYAKLECTIDYDGIEIIGNVYGKYTGIKDGK